MACPRLSCSGIAVLLSTLVLAAPVAAQGPEPGADGTQPGQFFPPIVEPIGHDAVQDLLSSVEAYVTRMAADGSRPVLVFEFRPGEVEPGRSRFGASFDLAKSLAEIRGASKTVAFVPESLSGYAVLPVLACDEIVIGPDATLGPIAAEGRTPGAAERAAVEELARSKGRDPDLLLGLLDPSLDLLEVRTGDGATHYVSRENLEAFSKEHAIVEEASAWEGRRGVLTPDRARRTIARLQTDDRSQVAQAYGLPSTSVDPTLAAIPKAIVIPIRGRINTLSESFLLRQVAEVRPEGYNLVFFEIDSEGGLYKEASALADAIVGLEGVKTVAFVDDRALGVASLVALACDEIVLREGARIGDVRVQLTGSDGRAEPLDERMTEILAERAEDLAREKGHPAAVARALVDPDAVVHRARDKEAGAVVLVLDSAVQAEPDRYEVLETPKSAQGEVLVLTDETARDYRMADRVVRDFDELQAAYGLRGRVLRQAQRTWVDGLVDTLNQSWVKGLLLFVGFFMLVLELKLPGIGLPAILASLAFLLYFWSSYLGGTADQLEILLFLVGLVCIALELFVFPGFGVFGMSGVLLVLVSVVMASHTFIWPTQDYEYRQLGWTLTRIIAVLVGVVAGAIVFGRYFPSLPLFNRLVLKPTFDEEEGDPLDKPSFDPDAPLSYLLGEVGRTTTVLKPTGRARFGDLLVDVTADGFYVEAGQSVEVVDVRGSRVTVKRVDTGLV